MSCLFPPLKENTRQVTAELDDLFTEQGIAIGGDGDTVKLTTGGQHNRPHQLQRRLPTSAQRTPKGSPPLRFEAAEHTAIGDRTLLRFANAPALPARQVPLHLPNGLALTYGQVIALGGDFYGIPDQPINEGASPAERVQRFTNAFNSLAKRPASNTEATLILKVMQKEIDAVNQAIKDGKQPHEAYDALADTLSEQWNRITGGGSFISALFPLGRYLKLAANNTDHFAEGALLAYLAGHTAALQQAALGHERGDENHLVLAYAMNAFADHYLTDLYSAGHLRVPRRQLAAVVTPSDLGSLISRFMHDEDSKFGLQVRNDNGDQWRMYGDKRYFDANDSANRAQVNQAVQISVDEIAAAFFSGIVPSAGQFAALKRLPDLQAVLTAQDNFSPLFKVEGNKVVRRKDVNDLNDTDTVEDWWGWSTYLLLKHYQPTHAPRT
jgi:hypothetical protein